MRICGRCGVYAPPQSYSCDHCRADLADLVRGVEWGRYITVAIEMQFACRGCGLLSPLDSLEVDGSVDCVRCGVAQRFDPSWWAAVLERAHAVGDLWGGDAEGRRRSRYAIDKLNPFADSALRHPGALFSEEPGGLGGQLPPNLRVWLAPGHPLGGGSGEPVDIAVKSPGHIRTRAPEERAQYVTGRRALKLHRGLVGAIADEQRMDRQETSAEVEEGASSFSCKGCGASLPIDGALKLVRCRHCSSVTYIPARVRHALQPEPEPDTWWLVFEGPSRYRRYLEWHPSTWDQAHPDPRPVEQPGVADRPPVGKLVAAGWYLCVPLVFLLVAGALLRAPWWVTWLSSGG